MEQTFELNRISRKTMASFLDNYTLAQLNTIPEGFNNSLFWNIAHVVVTQQVLLYQLSGLPLLVSQEWIGKYRKGTKPEQDASQAELEQLKALLFKTIDQTQLDFENGIFTHFTAYPTSLGFVLKNIQDAILFNNYHEGIHLGILMSIRKHL